MSFSNLLKGIWEDPLILQIALLCFGAHAFCALFLRLLPYDGPWKATPMFSAKQMVTSVMMIYQTYLGFVFWYSNAYQSEPALLVEDEKDMFDGGIYMSQIVVGSLLQDTPVGMVSGAFDIIMQWHHAGMFLVASTALGYWSDPPVPFLARYSPFFFGLIELSSIPLVLVDVFHPKQKEWFQYMQNHPTLRKLNEANRVIFALSYIAIRMILFPKVVLGKVLPDCWNKYQQEENKPYVFQILVIATFCLLFTALQMYWGSLIVKQIVKALKGGDSDEGKDSKAKPKIKAV